MTSFLRLNGIAVPVADGSFSVTQEDIGTMHRAEDGTPVFNRRGIRRTWRGTTTPQPPATGLAFRDLISGKGHVVSFDNNNFYTSKGLAPSFVDGSTAIETTSPKFGTRRIHSSGDPAAVTWRAFTSTSPWTVCFWRAAAPPPPWDHYVIRSDGAKWLNGVRNDGLSTGGFFAGGVSGGVVSLGGDEENWFDDVVMLPFVVPNDWPPQIFGFGSAFGALPTLAIDGLGVENNGLIIQAEGQAGEMHAFQVQVGGVVVPNYLDLAFELLED